MSSLDPTAPTPPPAPPARFLRAPQLRQDSVTVALGVAFLSAAIVVSGTRARLGSDLDLTVFLVGVVATLVLLGFGAFLRAAVPDRPTLTTLASWPLSFGAVGAGLMLGVLLDDGTSTTYLAGALVIALAALAYVVAPSAPPVVAGTFGVLLVYGQAFTDVADFDVAEDNGFKTFAFAVFLFVALVTALGWFLAPARTVVPVVVGAFAVVAYLGLIAAIFFTSTFAVQLTGAFGEEEPETPSYDGDVYTIFAFAVLLVLGWLVLGYLTDAPGYKVIVVAMVATVFPAGIALLGVEHPTAWGIGVGLLGAAVLGLTAARSRSTAAASAGHAGHPGPVA